MSVSEKCRRSPRASLTSTVKSGTGRCRKEEDSVSFHSAVMASRQRPGRACRNELLSFSAGRLTVTLHRDCHIYVDLHLGCDVMVHFKGSDGMPVEVCVEFAPSQPGKDKGDEEGKETSSRGPRLVYWLRLGECIERSHLRDGVELLQKRLTIRHGDCEGEAVTDCILARSREQVKAVGWPWRNRASSEEGSLRHAGARNGTERGVILRPSFLLGMVSIPVPACSVGPT